MTINDELARVCYTARRWIDASAPAERLDEQIGKTMERLAAKRRLRANDWTGAEGALQTEHVAIPVAALVGYARPFRGSCRSAAMASVHCSEFRFPNFELPRHLYDGYGF